MDPKLAEIIKKMNAARKTSHPWQRGQPFSQPYFSWQEDGWCQHNPKADRAHPGTVGIFSVLSWNIDFMRCLSQERMTIALSFLREYIEQIPNTTIIMLNEMLRSDLILIQDQPWIRQKFFVTDIDSQFWESGYYGTCMLIPKEMQIDRVFRVHYEDTAMERDGLFVDIISDGGSVRICSTHLESLIANPPKRPSQLATAAKFMHEAHASVLGGDLNAIQPFDKNLHSDNDLKDAYLEHGGIEDDENGMTWGQMAATKERQRFGLSRMDKLMYCGSLKLQHFERFGMDVCLKDPEKGSMMMEAEGLEKPWVTDHLGVRADFELATPDRPSASL